MKISNARGEHTMNGFLIATWINRCRVRNVRVIQQNIKSFNFLFGGNVNALAIFTRTTE